MAQGGAGDFDEEFVVAWRGDRDGVEVEFVVARVVLLRSHGFLGGYGTHFFLFSFGLCLGRCAVEVFWRSAGGSTYGVIRDVGMGIRGVARKLVAMDMSTAVSWGEPIWYLFPCCL